MFGTKVVTATYYRAHCENSLYYRTSRDHCVQATSCCISQCPVHYTVKFDADIFIQSGVLTLFFSHNLKIQDGGGRHLGFSGYANLVSVVFVFCTKSGSNMCYSHRDRRTYASDIHLMMSRKLTSGFDFWSRSHLRMAVMHLPIKFDARYLYQVQSY